MARLFALSRYQAMKVVSVVGLLSVATDRAMAQPGDDALPPPPDARAINDRAIFHLSLVLNHYDTGMVVPVTRRAGEFWVSSADLQRAGLPGTGCRRAMSISLR